VQLLSNQRKVGELHERTLEDHAERMALLVAERRVPILYNEFGRHAAAPAIAQIVYASPVINRVLTTIWPSSRRLLWGR
jgi:hypothetical protein